MARYYTASDISERCYIKYGIQLDEKDVSEIIKYIAPEENTDDLYTEKAFHNIKDYYEDYKTAFDELTKSMDGAVESKTIEERILEDNQRYDFMSEIIKELEKEHPENDNYENLENNLDRIKEEIQKAEKIKKELEKEDISAFEKYNKIKQANSNLDNAESILDNIERELGLHVEEIEQEPIIIETPDDDFEETEKPDQDEFERTEIEEPEIDEEIEEIQPQEKDQKVFNRIDVIGNGEEIDEPDEGYYENERELNVDESDREETESSSDEVDDRQNQNEESQEHEHERERNAPDEKDDNDFDDPKERDNRDDRNYDDLYEQLNKKQEAHFQHEDKDKENRRVDKGDKKRQSLNDVNIFKNREVQTAARSIVNTYQDVAEINRNEATQGYNKMRPLTDVSRAAGMIAVGRAANTRALEELNKIDFDEVSKILRNGKAIGRDANIAVSSENDRNTYLSVVKDYCRKQNLQNFTTLQERDLKALIASGKLNLEQKKIAESVLKVNKLGAGNSYIQRGKGDLKRSAIKFGERISDDNDVVTGASMIINVGRNARLAYKRFAKTAKYVRSVGQKGVNVATRLTKATSEKAGRFKREFANRRNKLRINTRPKTMKGARTAGKAANTTRKVVEAGSAVAKSAVVHTGTSVVAGAATGGIGAVVVHKVGGVFGMAKKLIKNPKEGAKAVAKALSKVASKVIAGNLGYLIGICVSIGAICTCIGCLVAFFVAIFSYTNDAFGTSNSLIENVTNFFDDLDLSEDGKERDDADGTASKVTDSVGYFALKNVSYFYTQYDEIIHKGLKNKIEDFGSNIWNKFTGDRKCQDISKIYANKDSVPEEPVDTFLYNDIEGNDALNRYFSESRGKKSIDPITYYISSNTVNQVMDGTVGSDYPYWNASEVLAMSSVKYSNSINPYNYRRYNRSLRYEAYSCDVGLIQSGENWFKDAFGMKETEKDNANVKIDNKQVFLSDPEITNKVDSDYTGEENIYVGFTKLTTEDINYITNGHHGGSGEDGPFLCEYRETHGGEYDEDIMSEVIENANDYLKERQQDGTAMCNHTTIGTSKERDSYTSTDGNGNEHEVVNTTYIVKFYCKGHYLAQAYVRCATLAGTGNLYQIDDANDGNKGWLESIIDKIFPNDYDKWSEAEGTDNTEPNVSAVEAKEEVGEMLTENWENTYGFTWEEIFPTPDDYKIYGTQLSQGDGRLADENGNETPLKKAKDIIEEKLNEIHSNQSDLTEEQIKRIEILDTAISYAGRLKYYYGANDVKNGISDCSAFISDALGIGRTTTADIMGWEHIGYEELQPGDLLCKDGHVRMYIATVQLQNGDIRYLTVENTSGSDATHGIHGCSCAYYSKTDLERGGYVGIDINGHYN